MRPLWGRTIIYYAIFICMGMTSSSIGPTLPGLAEQTTSTLSAISALFAFRAIGRLIGTAIAGGAYDRLPGHPLVGIGILFIVGMVFLTSFIPLLWLMCAVFFVLGFAESFMDVGVNTLLVWTYRERATPFINGLHLCFGVGAFLIPIIIAQIIIVTGSGASMPMLSPFSGISLPTPADDVRWVYRFLAAVFLPVGLIILLMRSPKSQAKEAHPTDEAPTTVSRGVILLFCTLFLLYVGAEVSFSGWIYTYALKLDLASPENAAYLVSAFWLMIMLGRIIAMALAPYLLPRTILQGALITALGGISLMLILPDALWPGTIIFGLGMSPIFPTALAFASRRVTLTGTITSYFYLGAGVGVAVFPWIIGQLIEPVGASALLWLILVAVIANIAILRWLIRKLG